MVNHKEQEYLTVVYGELLEKKEVLQTYLAQSKDEALTALQGMQGDVSLNFDSVLDNLDTFSQLEMKNREIDQMNFKMQTADAELAQVNRSLNVPYFGKVVVDFMEEAPEDFYIGINGFRNLAGDTRIYDWRSPIAELFYNNELGPSSYQVNGQKIAVEIAGRRQLIIERDRLLNSFDTSVAIQDDVLLEALENDTTGFMKDITATIQKEQNKIIRDNTSRHLLVNGIAGSGKTSTIMQRIAYLLYSLRQQITADDLLILSPNTQFIDYISNVLPALGERNPLNLTLPLFLQEFSSQELEDETEYFERLNAPVSKMTAILRSKAFVDYLKQADELLARIDLFQPIVYKGKVLISVETLQEFYRKTPNYPKMIDKLQAMKKQLLSYWDQRIIQQAHSERIQNQVLSLSEELQQHYFGELISDESEASIFRYSKKLLQRKYRKVAKALRQNEWINEEGMVAAIYQRFTGQEMPKFGGTIDESVIRLLVRHTFIEKSDVPMLRFILIDEIQDYTYAQITLLAALFPKTHFTMVGDENQAIFNSQIAFSEVQAIFAEKQQSVKRYDLLNSYRSSGAITKLFRKLVTTPMEILPVRPDGLPVTFRSFAVVEEFVQLVKEMSTKQQLTILTKTQQQAVQLTETLRKAGDQSQVLSISLAKGLEFDHVILYDVSAKNYFSEQDQKRLYTAISRGMQQVVVTYQDELTPLIHKKNVPDFCG